MKTLSILLALSIASFAAAQTAPPTATTLTYSIAPLDQAIILASTSGMAAGNVIYIDRESMAVVSVSGTTVRVNRGIAGALTSHTAAATAYFGARTQFFSNDPVGSCSAVAGVYVTPSTGHTWSCTSGVWVQQNGGGTGGSIGPITTGKIPKAISTSTVGDSSLSDDGTTVSTTEPLQVKSLTTGDGSTSSAIKFAGKTSGSSWYVAADAAGTAITYILPVTNGAANQALTDSGAATCPTLPAGAPTTCHQLIWATPSGGGITGLTTGKVPQATSPTAIGDSTLTAPSQAGTPMVVLSSQFPSGDTLACNTIGTTETAFATNYTIPANFFTAGKVLRLSIGTETTGTASPTFKPSIRLGSTAGSITGTAVYVAGSPSTSNSGTFEGGALIELVGTAAASSSASVVTSVQSVTLPWRFGASPSSNLLATNGSLLMQVTFACSAATSGNSLTLTSLTVQGN